tara:strand:- start:106 stop:345 length:240 start_codon:yes stop_codon:yes gene_type:complete
MVTDSATATGPAAKALIAVFGVSVCRVILIAPLLHSMDYGAAFGSFGEANYLDQNVITLSDSFVSNITLKAEPCRIPEG